MTAELPQMSAPATITRAFLNFEFMDASLLCWREKSNPFAVQILILADHTAKNPNNAHLSNHEDNVAFGSFATELSNTISGQCLLLPR
jgi:hypothetical protein